MKIKYKSEVKSKVHVFWEGQKNLKKNLELCFNGAGYSLWDQHILSPINPKYHDWFCQIYEDLNKNSEIQNVQVL